MPAGRFRESWRLSARWFTLVALLLFAHLGLAIAANEPDDAVVAERRIKAAYLFRFAGYTEWPPAAFSNAESVLTIGVWGDDELAQDLARLVAARTIEGHRLEVRRIRDTEGLAGLHMLFIARERTARLADVLNSAHLRATLVVTESAGALERGSALNFVTVDGQIRFELSLESAEKRGLKLSSRLVAVSTNLQGRLR